MRARATWKLSRQSRGKLAENTLEEAVVSTRTQVEEGASSSNCLMAAGGDILLGIHRG
jgi:hypothetical protein